MTPVREEAEAGLGNPRYLRSLDHAGWRWQPGRASPAGPEEVRTGRSVWLPHSWNADEEYTVGRIPARGWATYQLDLDVPELDGCREWRLQCDGFYGIGRAWVNRRCVGRFNGDFLGFDLEVTTALRRGLNRLTIQVCNRYSRRVLPALPDPDFHLYGGLGGSMRLVALPQVRLESTECRAMGMPDQTGGVCVGIGVVNRTGACAVRCASVSIRDGTGKVVAEAGSHDLTVAPDECVHR